MEVRCRICGGNTALFVENEKFYKDDRGKSVTYDVRGCHDCGLLFIDPEPSLDALSRLYGDEYGCYKPAPSRRNLWKFKIAEWRFSGFGRKQTGADKLLRAVGACVEVVTGRRVSFTMGIPLTLPKAANILEVGHGAGDWLIALKRMGYQNLYGVDISNRSTQRLMDWGIHAATGDILTMPLPDAFFDLIRLEHCFEHFTAPGDHLRRLGALLRPGGMVVMTVPNRDSLNMNWFLDQSGLWQMPFHVYHWGARSIAVLAAQHGFKVEQIRTLPVVEQMIESMLNRFARRTPSKTWWVLGRLISPVYAAICNIGENGDFLSLVLRADGSAAARSR